MIRHVVLDMDGVLYRGDQVLPGAIETLHALRQQGVNVAFLTNNASRHRQELADKMARLGFPCSRDEVWGSAYTAARYLATEAPGAQAFLVGTSSMAREMREAGVAVVPTHEGATHVIVGLDPTLTYQKLVWAHYAICNGAQFIATNLDPTFPDSLTTTTPGGGAIVAALITSTGKRPLVMGKPETTGIALIASSWGVEGHAIAAVGDRLDTDIASGKAFGALGVLVLTGVSSRAEAEAAQGVEKPDIIINDLTELPAVLARA